MSMTRPTSTLTSVTTVAGSAVRKSSARDIPPWVSVTTASTAAVLTAPAARTATPSTNEPYGVSGWMSCA
jgi:hypothetical protein